MTLLKLIAYSLLGYVIYELYLGISTAVEAKAEAASAPAKPSTQPKTLAGPKRSSGGRFVSVQGSGGARNKRSVGRGVI